MRCKRSILGELRVLQEWQPIANGLRHTFDRYKRLQTAFAELDQKRCGLARQGLPTIRNTRFAFNGSQTSAVRQFDGGRTLCDKRGYCRASRVHLWKDKKSVQPVFVIRDRLKDSLRNER